MTQTRWSDAQHWVRGLACAAIVCGAATLPQNAQAAGGAYAVDDVEVGGVRSCKVESWASFADNSDFIGTVSPACVVNLGRPVELNAQLQRFGSGGEWGSTLTFKGKTTLIPIEPNKIGLGLIAGTTFDLVNRVTNGVFVTLPVSFQVHEQVRVNVNGGWLWDPSAGEHAATWGAGFEWNFVKPLTLIGEVFGVAAPGQRDPRFQAGLRFTPQEDFDIDLIYGRNITGEHANWITVGLNVRFGASDK